MSTRKFVLGVHAAKSSKVLQDKTPRELDEAIVQDTNVFGLNAAQVFTYGPKFMVKNKYNTEKVIQCTADIDLSVHSAYSTVSVWKVTEANRNTADSKKYIKNVVDQLRAASEIGAWGLVIHISRQHPKNVAYVMTQLKQYAVLHGVTILLEMVSSKSDPDLTYETPEKIDNLTYLIGADETWWGWCVDTAHLWGAGVDVSSYNNMNDWFSRVTYKKKILMIHLNGSFADMGDGKDKHAVCFGADDLIWHGIAPKKSGVQAVVEFAVQYSCTVICEINTGSQKTIARSLNVIKDIGLGLEELQLKH